MKGGNPRNQPRLGGPRPPKRHTRGRPSRTGPFAAEGVAPPLADHEPAGLLLADAAIVAPGPSSPFPPLPLALRSPRGRGARRARRGARKGPRGKALRSRAPGTRASKGNENVHPKTHSPPVPKPTLTRPTPWPLGPLSPFPPSPLPPFGARRGKGGRGEGVGLSGLRSLRASTPQGSGLEAHGKGGGRAPDRAERRGARREQGRTHGTPQARRSRTKKPPPQKHPQNGGSTPPILTPKF